MSALGFCALFDDVWIVDYVRTPLLDYASAFGSVLRIDLGIEVARERFGCAPDRGRHPGGGRWLLDARQSTGGGRRA